MHSRNDWNLQYQYHSVKLYSLAQGRFYNYSQVLVSDVKFWENAMFIYTGFFNLQSFNQDLTFDHLAQLGRFLYNLLPILYFHLIWLVQRVFDFAYHIYLIFVSSPHYLQAQFGL